MHEIQGNIKWWKGDWSMQRNQVMHHRSLRAELLLEQGLYSTHFLLPRSGRGGNQKMHLCFPNIVWLVCFWEEKGWWFIAKCVFALRFFFINLSLGTQVHLERAAQEQELHSERFLTFRKLHNDKHDSSSSSCHWSWTFMLFYLRNPVKLVDSQKRMFWCFYKNCGLSWKL